jgi:hypothetical protein
MNSLANYIKLMLNYLDFYKCSINHKAGKKFLV